MKNQVVVAPTWPNTHVTVIIMDNEASDSSDSSQTRYGSKKRICASLLFACIAGVGFDACLRRLYGFFSVPTLSPKRVSSTTFKIIQNIIFFFLKKRQNILPLLTSNRTSANDSLLIFAVNRFGLI